MRKNELIRFLLLLVAISSTQAAFAETVHKSVTVRYSESDFTIRTNKAGQIEITAHDIAALPEGNEPGLPLFGTSIAVPAGYDYVSSTVNAPKRLIMENVVVAQSPEPVPTSMLAEYPDPDYKITYPESVYPKANCLYTGSLNWDNAAVLQFLTTPFVYDAKEKKLYFIDSIDVDILMNDGSESGKRNIADRKLSERVGIVDGEMLKSFVDNPEEIDALLSSIVIPAPIGERIDYVIITNEELKPAFQPLIDWKRTKGLYSKIVTMEEVRDSIKEGDDPLKLKTYLHGMHIKNSLRYVLLGGDDTVVPVRGCYGMIPNQEKITIDLTIPSDIYYTCFGGNSGWGGDFNLDWDKNGDGIYGKSEDDPNFAQALYLTRAPVRSTIDCESFVSKIIGYESSPRFSNSILMSGVQMGILNDSVPNYESLLLHSDAEQMGDRMYNEYIKPYWNGKRYKFYDTQTDFPGGKNLDVTADNFSDIFSQGFDFINMDTHGLQTLWCMENGADYGNIYGLRQSNQAYSIVLTGACYTNAFDTSSEGGKSDPCLSESLIRNKDSGVVAYLGCSRYAWGHMNGSALSDSFLFNAKFFKTLFSHKSIGYGMLINSLKADLHVEPNEYGVPRWLLYGINPIGDPEMPIFTKEPKQFINVEITVENGSLTVKTNVLNSNICLTTESGNEVNIFKTFENTDFLSLDYVPEDLRICVTKQGFVPFVAKLLVYRNSYYLQNVTFKDNIFINSDLVRIGSDVHASEPHGPVTIKSGLLNIKGKDIRISPEFMVKEGAEFIISPKQQK